MSQRAPSGLSLGHRRAVSDSITGMNDDTVACRKAGHDFSQLSIAMTDADEGCARPPGSD